MFSKIAVVLQPWFTYSQLSRVCLCEQARTGVVVVGATNRPDCVDNALLRPGRFDRLLYVPPPDTAARLAILEVHTRHTPLALDVGLQVCERYASKLNCQSCLQCYIGFNRN